MEPHEIASLYNFIFKTGDGLHTDIPMAVIGGMEFFNETWRSSGRKGFAIRRREGIIPDCTLRWSINFHLVDIHQDLDRVGILCRGTRDFGFGGGRKVVASPVEGRLQIDRIEGDYDAYVHDSSLLRMFESEWQR
jgi:hypothetical protein